MTEIEEEIRQGSDEEVIEELISEKKELSKELKDCKHRLLCAIRAKVKNNISLVEKPEELVIIDPNTSQE